MPTYEFKCLKCGYHLEVFKSISEKDKGLDLTCPKCGSKEFGEVFGSMVYISKTGEIKNIGGCSCGSCN